MKAMVGNLCGKMKPYGKVRSNVYENSPQTISKKSARQLEKNVIQEHLESNLFDLWGCDESCTFCNDWSWIDCDSNPLCDCEHCIPKHENQGNGWKKC